jgi:hypothetical protein
VSHPKALALQFSAIRAIARGAGFFADRVAQ